MTDLGELKSHPARKDAFCNIKPHFAKKKKKRNSTRCSQLKLFRFQK